MTDAPRDELIDLLRADMDQGRDAIRRSLNEQLFRDSGGSHYTTTVTRIPRWRVRLARVRGYFSHLWSALLGRACECPYDHDY